MAEKIRLGYGALSSDTELLTPTGWTNIAKVTKETLVAQYWVGGQITFGYPTFIRVEKIEKAVHIYNKLNHYNQLVGIYHAIPYVNTRSQKLQIRSANKIGSDESKRYIHSGFLENNNKVTLNPLDRLRIAFQADGTNRITKRSNYIVFALKKSRKIERLHMLLKNANVDYKTCLTSRGYVQLYFSAPVGFYEKDFSWVNLTQVSTIWCQEFIEELSHWDSTVPNSKKFRCTYGNNRKIAVDIAQAIAILGGYKTLISSYTPNKTNCHTHYSLYISTRYKSTQGGNIIAEIINYDNLMYVVRMSSNMLVMRRNDAVSITGCSNFDTRLSKDPVINTNCGHLI